jgi:hypothetical protein
MAAFARIKKIQFLKASYFSAVYLHVKGGNVKHFYVIEGDRR